MPILIAALIILGLLYLISTRSKKDTGGHWVQFFSKGREAGFSFKEIEMLRHLTIQCGFESPISVFESQSLLDKCIHSMVRGIKMAGETDEQETQQFLSKLYDFRKKVEMDKPHIKTGISNSRQITEGQMLRVLVNGAGVFKSQVVKNTGQYMTISRPVNEKNPSAMPAWMGTKLSVYFWKEDDAGYVFDSDVLDEVFSLGIASLKISHGESLFRTQKRQSVRIKMHKAAFLYLVPPGEAAHKMEIDPGLKCFLEDISDTGYAVAVGGKATKGVRVKVQFELDNSAICMTGIVRSINYNEELNRSVLHIQAEPLNSHTRNQILGEVFGMLPEGNEDDLPFRVLDDEMANLTTDMVQATTTTASPTGNNFSSDDDLLTGGGVFADEDGGSIFGEAGDGGVDGGLTENILVNFDTSENSGN